MSQDELQVRFRQTHNTIERTRWQIIGLIVSSKRVKEVAQIISYTEPYSAG